MSQPRNPHDPYRDHAAHDELLAQRADQLAVMLHAVKDSIAGLNERAEHIEKRAESADQRALRAAKANKRAIIALIIVAAFVAVGGWLLVQNQQNISQIRDLQQQGISLRQDTLCPILRAALSNDSPQARAQFPAGPIAHDRFIARLQHGVDAMNCAPLTN